MLPWPWRPCWDDWQLLIITFCQFEILSWRLSIAFLKYCLTARPQSNKIRKHNSQIDLGLLWSALGNVGIAGTSPCSLKVVECSHLSDGKGSQGCEQLVLTKEKTPSETPVRPAKSSEELNENSDSIAAFTGFSKEQSQKLKMKGRKSQRSM